MYRGLDEGECLGVRQEEVVTQTETITMLWISKELACPSLGCDLFQEAIAPTGPMGMPAKFAFSFCVRRAPYFCDENNAGFTYSKPREKSWNVPWWWGGERFGKIRQPFGYARRLVIGDVVDAR